MVTANGEFSCTDGGTPTLTLLLAERPKPSRKKIATDTQNTGLRSW